MGTPGYCQWVLQGTVNGSATSGTVWVLQWASWYSELGFLDPTVYVLGSLLSCAPPHVHLRAQARVVMSLCVSSTLQRVATFTIVRSEPRDPIAYAHFKELLAQQFKVQAGRRRPSATCRTAVTPRAWLLVGSANQRRSGAAAIGMVSRTGYHSYPIRHGIPFGMAYQALAR
jgi:hypothetical protein